MYKLTTLILFTLFFNLAQAQTRDYYVDAVNGSDVTGVGDGSFTKPYKTIGKAGDRAKAGETIFLRKGVYRERAWIQNSGFAGSPIVITA